MRLPSLPLLVPIQKSTQGALVCALERANLGTPLVELKRGHACDASLLRCFTVFVHVHFDKGDGRVACLLADGLKHRADPLAGATPRGGEVNLPVRKITRWVRVGGFVGDFGGNACVTKTHNHRPVRSKYLIKLRERFNLFHHG